MNGEYWSTTRLAAEAQRLGASISHRTIQRMCARGEIEAIQPARDYLIPDHAARAWLEAFNNQDKDGPAE